MESNPSEVFSKFEEIDWANWKPTEYATIIFVIKDERVLLIRKKRGLGAGKVNGPGGKQDKGETLAQCAVRELEEELLVKALGEPDHRGELLFQFSDGYGLYVHVFTACDILGDPMETEEAYPLWTPLNAIPYEEMWEDDKIWLPLMLKGMRFRGRFLFCGDQMVDYQLETLN